MPIDQRAIAKRFGISDGAVSAILCGRIWKSVGGERRDPRQIDTGMRVSIKLPNAVTEEQQDANATKLTVASRALSPR